MAYARHAGLTEDHGRMAVVRAAEKVRREDENGRAALTVAQHSSGRADCAELLDMLGLLPIHEEEA